MECAACGNSFCWTNILNKHNRERIWFIRWITEGYTIKQLAIQSGHSKSKIREVINYWLSQEPGISFKPDRHLVLDGSFLERRMYSIFAVMNGNHRLMDGQYQLAEKFKQLTQYFYYLQGLGLRPHTATVDGNPAITRALLVVWPKIVIQRCLVHIQRQGLQWCRRKPKRTDAKQLRRLLLTLTDIRTTTERNLFLEKLLGWETRYGSKIALLPEKGWVVPDIQRARSMVLKAVPYMFVYLDHAKVPKTTNSIEGYFSRLKLRYRQHRGLSRVKRTNYFKWYFHLVKC